MFASLLRFSPLSATLFCPLRFSSLLVLLFINVSNAGAQVNSYSFTSTTGNALETGGFATLLGINQVDVASPITNIGFTFRFGSTDYTTFSVGANGLLRLGGACSIAYNNNTSNLSGAYLSPYWDDNYTGSDGNVQYKVMGAPGNRKLVVEYNVAFYGAPTAADKHFQVWMFETSNQVQFVYGNGNNTNAGFTVAVLTNGVTDFIAIDAAAHTSNIVTKKDNNVTWPGAGRAYSFTPGSILPITLLNFSGYKDGFRNQLQWTTTTEINNKGFDLQRSANGTDFTTIDFIYTQAPGGNSNSTLYYQFTDNAAAGNKYYYRLRQVDLDDRAKLSPVIFIDGRHATAVKLDGAFPNPASNSLNLQIISPGMQTLSISMYDMAGKIVMQQIIPIGSGNNIIPVDISQLAKNMYVVKITDSNGNNCGSLKVTVIK